MKEKKLKPPQHLIEKHSDLLQRMAVCMAKAELARESEKQQEENKRDAGKIVIPKHIIAKNSELLRRVSIRIALEQRKGKC